MDVDSWCYGHSRTQHKVFILPGLKLDPNRNALDYLDIIAGGVFRREKAEAGSAGSRQALDLTGVSATRAEPR